MRSYANETDSREEVSVVRFKQEDLQATGGMDIGYAGNNPVIKGSIIGKNNCSSLPGALTPIYFLYGLEIQI